MRFHQFLSVLAVTVAIALPVATLGKGAAASASAAKSKGSSASVEDEFEKTLSSLPEGEDLDLVYTPDDAETPEAQAAVKAASPESPPAKQDLRSTASIGSRKRVCRPLVAKRKASYYANYFNGRRTASGIRFSNKELFTAHPTLPMGSVLSVSNPKTGASIEVTVVDRGPFRCKSNAGKRVCVPHPTREIDLSQRAYTALFGTLESGEHIVDVAICD